MATQFTSEQLANGVQINFNDVTNRYYGDYHRVCIEVELRFASEEFAQGHKFQTLERMGVSSADVESVQEQVLNSFRQGTMRYMVSENFENKFLKSCKTRKSILLPGLK
ncbi:MAG: hypothetical protein BA874_07400 [Desulfuromonadales bacterium C00003068]|jgi:hypothetical protein|nr:hypothetical protein [Deltaproteobacteria bacterium]OEU71665.1 MAG: hypothetical protein BA874_07400 [Desulfuromonadales bacterium C00003068]